MLVCACSRAGTSQCTRCMYSNLHLGDIPGLPKMEPTLEIYRLKELLCVIRECAVSDFDDRAVKLAGKGIEDDFHIPLLRFKEILKSL